MLSLRDISVASQYPVCPTNSEIYRTPGTDSPKICSGDQFTTCPQGYECYYGYGSAYGYCCSISSRQTFGQIGTFLSANLIIDMASGSSFSVSNPFYQQCYDDYPTYCNLNRAYCSQYPVFQQSCKKTCGACTDRRYSTCPNGQPGGKICTYTSECPVYSSCVNSVCCPQCVPREQLSDQTRLSSLVLLDSTVVLMAHSPVSSANQVASARVVLTARMVVVAKMDFQAVFQLLPTVITFVKALWIAPVSTLVRMEDVVNLARPPLVSAICSNKVMQ